MEMRQGRRKSNARWGVAELATALHSVSQPRRMSSMCGITEPGNRPLGARQEGFIFWLLPISCLPKAKVSSTGS